MLNSTLKHILFLECFESSLVLKIKCQKGEVGSQTILILSVVTWKMVAKTVLVQ